MAENYQLFQNLLLMAAADGGLSRSELELLADRAAVWGIDDEQFAQAIAYAQSETAELQLPPHVGDRESLLSELLRMMAADGHLAETERRLFSVAAAAMRFGEDDINRIIDQTLNSEG